MNSWQSSQFTQSFKNIHADDLNMAAIKGNYLIILEFCEGSNETLLGRTSQLGKFSAGQRKIKMCLIVYILSKIQDYIRNSARKLFMGLVDQTLKNEQPFLADQAHQLQAEFAVFHQDIPVGIDINKTNLRSLNSSGGILVDIIPQNR